MATRSKQRVLRSGVVIAEKYRVDKAIARGGFSVIYRGTHIEMQRPVALKLLSIDDQIKPTWLERFTREARLASQLTHPNTVTIFDYGQDARGFLYIVMEWVEGVSLYHHLKKHGSLSAIEVAEISAQILQSLDEAHQRGFLHRDLKPSNIMLSHDYEGEDLVKVLDFGIAKHLEDASQPRDAVRITHKGAFIGTPRYASPEQLDDKELTPAADIYSLGLLMWEALVGDPAVPSVEYADCVQMHLGEEPWRLPNALQCPPGLAAILYRALEKSVERRYQSCREMHRELMAWLGSDEARSESSQDFFLGASAREGFESMGLGGESSAVDDDELFGGLADEHSAGDDSPLELHGTADDSFELELMEIADDASKRERNDSRVASSPPVGPRAAQPAAAQPRAAPIGSVGPRSSRDAASSVQSQKTIVVSALAAALVLGAGAYVAFSGDDADSDVAEEVVAEDDSHVASEKQAPLDPEAEADDGSPTFAADILWQAISRTKWRRIGDVDTLEFSDVRQSSARFRKQSMTVTITIYETDSHTSAEQYLAAAEEPVQAVRFGKTAVHVGPGSKGTSSRGVYELMSTLYEIKAIAREQAE